MTDNTHRERAYYNHFYPITTRWSDNDQYGHVNNSIYYLYFDALVNKYLIEYAGLNPSPESQLSSAPIGLVIQSGCHYYAPSGFPEDLEGGLKTAKLGNSSVTYHLGIFRKEKPDEAVATGTFTHVFVDPKTRRPVRMMDKMRSALSKL